MRNVIEVAGFGAATRGCAGVLLLVVTAALARPASAQHARGARSAQGHAALSCRDGGWSAAQDVRMPNGDYLYVERPAIVAVDGGTAFVGQTGVYDSTGTPVATWGHGPRRLPDSLADFAAGVLLRTDGSYAPLRQPPGLQQRMEFPRGMSDGRRATVLWGVVLDTTALLGTVQEIQVATLDSSGWSAPRVVVRNPSLRWFRPGVDVTRAPDGSIHAVVILDLMGGGGVLHLSNASGEWRADSVAWLRGPLHAYPQLEVLDRDRYLLVVQGAAAEERQHGSSRLFAYRSDDGGATWSEPVAISTRPMEDAYEPRLFRLGDTLGVAWRQSPPSHGVFGLSGPDAEGDSVRLSLSRDGGRTWHAEPPLVAPYGLSDFTLRATRHGILVAGQSTGAPTRPSATWMDGMWHWLGAPQTPDVFTAPNLGRTPDGRFVMSWGRWFAHRHSVMQVSLLAPACAP